MCAKFTAVDSVAGIEAVSYRLLLLGSESVIKKELSQMVSDEMCFDFENVFYRILISVSDVSCF